MSTLLALILTLSFIPQISTDTLKTKIKGFRNSKHFSIKYDKSRDRTDVEVGPFLLSGAGVNQMSLGMALGFAFDSQEMREEPESFTWLFLSSGYEWRFQKSRGLYVMADRELIGIRAGNYQYSISQGIIESLAFKIDKATLTKIANAKQVEINVGPTAISLKDEHLEALRNMQQLAEK